MGRAKDPKRRSDWGQAGELLITIIFFVKHGSTQYEIRVVSHKLRGSLGTSNFQEVFTEIVASILLSTGPFAHIRHMMSLLSCVNNYGPGCLED